MQGEGRIGNATDPHRSGCDVPLRPVRVMGAPLERPGSNMEAETRLLLDITFLMAVAGLCSIILVRLRMPSIIGYLVAGIVLGPTMLPELSVNSSTVFMLSNLGIVLLMFYIGMELNLRELRRIGSFTIIVVTIEMAMMVLIGYLVGMALGLGPVTSIFLGAIISGTSTAVVVGVLHSLKVTGTQVAKAAIGITVLEDIGQVIILTLAAPLLVGQSPTLNSTALMVLLISAFIAVSIIVGITVVPRMLDWIGKRYSGETLLIVSIALCFTMALISSTIGLSIAIGAFLMGLMVSQSSFVTIIKSKVEPLKELFMAVFFISIGIQIDPLLVVRGLPLAAIIALTFILAKVLSVSIASYINNMKMRSSFQVATSLAVMGEFAFIIAKVALDAGQVGPEFYSSILGAALITMLCLPLLSKNSARIFDGLVNHMPLAWSSLFTRISMFKKDVSARFDALQETRRKARAELLLISIDLVIIISMMLVLQLLVNEASGVLGIGDGDLLPTLLLFMASLVLITPAVFNTLLGIRRMADALTGGGPSEKDGGGFGGTPRYRIVRNVGNAFLAGMLILLYAPFLPLIGDGHHSAIVLMFLTWMAFMFAVWKSYRRLYEGIKTRINADMVFHDEEGTMEPPIAHGRE